MVTDTDIIEAVLAYPYLDFDVDTYISEFDQEADSETVEQVVKDSAYLEWFTSGHPYISDWSSAMDALSEEMDTVEGVVGKGNDFDRVFDRATFDIDEEDSRESITVDAVKNGREYELIFESEDIAIRHQKVFEEDDEEIEEYSHEQSPDAGWVTYLSEEGDAFNEKFINAHIEKLDHACYYVGGNDPDRDDVTHTVWIEPAGEETVLRYIIDLNR